MKPRSLRSPRERVGTLPNADLPPPDATLGKEDRDHLLHRALVQRDENAFAAVARMLRPEMIRIATRYVRSRDDAEDVVQETWLAALTAIHRFEGRASLYTWLLRILGYTARAAGRKAARATPLSQLPFPPSDGDLLPQRTPLLMYAAPGPEERLLGRELESRIAACIARLPKRQRQVITLRDLDGRSGAHVSDALGVTQGHQRVLLHRARGEVRRALADYRNAGAPVLPNSSN